MLFFFFGIPEKERLQAEAKEAEEARRKAEMEAAAEAASEAKRKLELEREAARKALLEVNIYIKNLPRASYECWVL